MRLRLIWVGKTKNAHVAALADDYVRRLSRFCRVEVTELREATGGGVLLDVAGREFDSHELAARVGAWQNAATKEVAFVIGGHLGVSDEIRGRADLRWSLSRLTLTHELARVVVAEQLYRAFTILRGLPYQK